MYIVICIPSLVEIGTHMTIYIYVYQVWLKLLKAFQSYAGTYTPTITHTSR
jgi:hypothetical protein